MKYPDTNIQIEYPNKLINADTPSVKVHMKEKKCERERERERTRNHKSRYKGRNRPNKTFGTVILISGLKKIDEN